MSKRSWIFFAIVSVLWGIPYLFISVAVDDGIPPAFLAWARVLLGALILIPLAWRAGVLGSLRGRARWLLPYAIAEIVIPFPLIAAGEQHVSSSIAAILIAATPLIVAVLALIGFDRSERVGGLRLVGLLVGFAGVVALVGVDVAGDSKELLGAGAILLAAVGYAVGPMTLQRGLGDLDPRAIMAGALSIAAVLLTPFAAIDLPSSSPSASAIASIVVLGVFCTAAAFVFFAALVSDVGAGRALVITYIAPVVAVVGAVVVLDESLGAGTIVGLLLIFTGSWLATGGGLPPGGNAAARLRRRPEPTPRGA